MVQLASPTTDVDAEDGTASMDPELLEEDLLIEDVSIDGMCGVY